MIAQKQKKNFGCDYNSPLTTVIPIKIEMSIMSDTPPGGNEGVGGGEYDD